MLSRLEVLRYKAFKYIDVNISNFNVLVGPNASGKSTLLDVFTLLKDILVLSPHQAIERRSSRFDELVWKQQENKFEIAIEFCIPQHIEEKLKEPKYSKARYGIVLAKNQEHGIIIESENLWLIKDINKIEYNLKIKKERDRRTLFPMEPILPTSIVYPPKKTHHGWRKVISKIHQGNDYFRSETTDWNTIYRFGPTKSSLARVPEDTDRFPISLWVKNFLTEGIQFLQLNSVFMRWPCRPDLPTSFQTDGSNLPKVVKYLGEKVPKNLKRWIEHIKTALPDIEEIGIKERPEDRFLYLYVRHKSQLEIPSWLLSDGTLRLLAQTLIPYLPEKGRIYMIEEPENGLHPLAIESIFQSLSSVYDNQILLATHSPAILRLAEPKDILCFSKTESGAVDIVRGTDHPKLRDWRKDVDLATLHASGVLQ